MEELFMTMKMPFSSSSSSSFSSLVLGLIIGLISWFLYNMYGSLWYKSRRVRMKLRAQGIKGPPPSFLLGNLPLMQRIQAQNHHVPPNTTTTTNNNNNNINNGSKNHHHHQFLAHDYTSTLFPYFEHWRKQYGQLYTYSRGMKQHLYVNQPELVRELNQCITLDLGKPSHITNKLAPLLGNGILRANGLSWAHQRKLVAAQFFMDKVKGMMGLMIESAQPLLTKWEQLIEAQEGSMAEVKVDEDLRDFSADVISRVCFGHSYSKGNKLFSKLRSIQKAMSDHCGFLFGLSGFRDKLVFSTKNKQNQISTLEKEIESLIWELVEERKRECSSNNFSEKDLMQLLLEAAMTEEQRNLLGGKINEELISKKNFIVDNCKNIYFAGHETTAVAASWSLMLLALHPQWQDQIRNEVAQFCHHGIPDADTLPLLKTVTMVIHEVLRLYPPAAFVSREAYEDIQIGDLNIPKGVCLWTLIPRLHRDPEIWGQDSHEFKPERFKEGVSQACKFPQAYVPFGLGPRLCLGKNFAMVELKIVLALIISKFSFSLSLSYKHSPTYRMIVEPGHGVYINIKKI